MVLIDIETALMDTLELKCERISDCSLQAVPCNQCLKTLWRFIKLGHRLHMKLKQQTPHVYQRELIFLDTTSQSSVGMQFSADSAVLSSQMLSHIKT